MSLLDRYVICGRTEYVEEILSNGSNLDASSIGGNELVRISALNNHPYLTKKLYDILSKKDLLTCILVKDIYFVKLLLKTEDVNYTDTYGNSLLMWAVHQRDIEIVKLLIQSGVDVDAVNKINENSLVWAARYNFALNEIFHASTVDMDLINCSLLGDIKTLKNITNKFSNVNITDCSYRTPLMLAAMCDHLDCVELLINKGASIQFENIRGETALRLALTYQQNSTARFLLNIGAEKNHVDCTGWSILHHTIVSGNLDGVKMLLDLGSSIDIKDKYGYTPLMLCCMFPQAKYFKIASMLCIYGANVNSVDETRHCTPLILAAENGCLQIVEILLSHGANVEFKTKFGQTAISKALDEKDSLMLELLLNG